MYKMKAVMRVRNAGIYQGNRVFETWVCNYFKRVASVPFPLQLSFLCSFNSKLTTATTATDNGSNSDQREQKLLSLFKPCSTMMDLQKIHAQIIRTGFDQHIFVVGKIITFCAVSEEGSMDYAASIFDEIKNPDGFIWNTMIRGFGKTSKPEQAFVFYRRMEDNGEVVDNFTFSFLLKICAQLSTVELGKQIHCRTVKHGLDSHVFVRNTLIHMYGQFKDVGIARQLFDEIPRSDLVSWNNIIDCYVQCGQTDEALRLFLRMQQIGLEPDEATLVIVLSACAHLGNLDFGRRIHLYIDGSRFDRIIAVSNSLIDMYSKCGGIEDARQVFDRMTQRNIVSWNSMILGLAMHGHATEALELFSRMQKWENVAPNDITFLGILCACSHGGLVDEGRMHFDSMIKDYCIRPTIKHYGCMVDLLGRAGLVDEAYELIQTKPMACNAVVWRALLGACRVHGKLVLGELVRKHLMALEPDHSGDYVLLANMYARAGRWDNVLKVREAMRDRGVQKPEPGNSLIDADATSSAYG